MSNETKSNLIPALAGVLKSRLDAFGVKPGSKRASAMEADFVSGACAAIHAMHPHPDPEKLSPMVPPMLILAPLSGRSILDLAKEGGA